MKTIKLNGTRDTKKIVAIVAAAMLSLLLHLLVWYFAISVDYFIEQCVFLIAISVLTVKFYFSFEAYFSCSKAYGLTFAVSNAVLLVTETILHLVLDSKIFPFEILFPASALVMTVISALIWHSVFHRMELRGRCKHRSPLMALLYGLVLTLISDVLLFGGTYVLYDENVMIPSLLLWFLVYASVAAWCEYVKRNIRFGALCFLSLAACNALIYWLLVIWNDILFEMSAYLSYAVAFLGMMCASAFILALEIVSLFIRIPLRLLLKRHNSRICENEDAVSSSEE